MLDVARGKKIKNKTGIECFVNKSTLERERWLSSSVCAQSYLSLCNTMDCSLPGSSVHGFSRQEYWNGLPFPTLGNLPDPGTEPISLDSSELAGRFFTAVHLGSCLITSKRERKTL